MQTYPHNTIWNTTSGIEVVLPCTYALSLNVWQGTEGLEDFQYETILGFQDPHLVGIATKRPTITTTSSVSKDKVPKKSKKSRP